MSESERNMLIKVTRKDIEGGKPDDCYSCPVARALKRHLKTNHIEVGGCWGWAVGKSYFNLPKTAVAFIKKFDAGMEVKPFSFNLKAK